MLIPVLQLKGLENHLDILVDQGLFQEGQKWKDTKITEWPWTCPIKHRMQYDGYIENQSFRIVNVCYGVMTI